jgi:hypothetical protein
MSMQESQLKTKKDKFRDTADFSKTTSSLFSIMSDESPSK